jgi:hypothetical protein
MAKKTRADQADEKIVKEVLRLIPRLPKTIKWLSNKAERFNYREPTTFISDVRAELDKCVPFLGGKGNPKTLRRLWRLLSRLPLKKEGRHRVNEIIRLTKQEAAKDPRYSLLLRLMSEADKKVPLVSIIVSMRHGDPIESLGPQCAPYDVLEQAERTRGELRATFALRALSETYEPLYRSYLITIWSLSYLKEGETPPPQVPSTGNLVKESHKRLYNYPGLVEPDAGWMRNSAVHNPRKYIVEEDAVEMWGKAVDRRVVRVDELLAMVKRMYQISGVTIQRVGQLYMFRTLFGENGFFDEIVESFPVLLSSRPEEIQQVEGRFEAKAEKLFRPMADFFEAQSPPPTA